MGIEVTPVVVAGGRSRRFGTADKLVATLAGRPIIDHTVVAAAEALGTDPILATRDGTHEARLAGAVRGTEVRFVHDHPEYAGPVAGIAAAVTDVDTPWTFICGGDMPWLSNRAIQSLCTRCERLKPAGVVPVRDGRPEPLHGLYRTADLERAVAGACGRTSVRGVIERLSPLVTVPTTHADRSFRRSLADVDEPSDLRPDHVEFAVAGD